MVTFDFALLGTLCGVTLAVTTLPVHADTRATMPAPQAAAIEQGLRPAVVLQGRPVPTRSLAAAMEELHVPGVSVALIRAHRVAWTKSYGVTRAGGPEIDASTLFQAGSISKSVTAVGALQLVKNDRLSLDEDINDRLSTWKLPASASGERTRVTLRELLSHTAGVNVHGFPGYAADKPVPTLLQVLDGLPPANTPAIRRVAEPGVRWSYSGGGYTIVQQLMDDVTEQPFQAWMRAHVLQPADMVHSSFSQPLPAKHAAEAASPHDAAGIPIPGGPHVYPEMAAAGLWSTPTDLARFLIAIQKSLAGKNDSWLGADAARDMLKPLKPGHSMGFDVGGDGADTYFSKSGDTEGFAAFMVSYPMRGEGAVVMTNGTGGTVLARELMRSIATAYGWKEFGSRVRASERLKASTMAHFAGTYSFRDQQFTVHAANGQLTLGSPGETPERTYAASPRELFVLSQDVSFVFDGDLSQPCQSGHLQIGGQQVPFHRMAISSTTDD